MLTPYGPHGGIGPDPQGKAIRYPPAPRDRAASPDRPKSWGEVEFKTGDCGPVLCQDVPWPDTSSPESFNVVQDVPLPWMAHTPLTAAQLLKNRKYHVQRIQMVQSIDDMLGNIRQTLDETGQANSTWIMFTSDNGYHLGEHAMFAGKTTAYDHDIKTPLMIHPPGGVDAAEPVTTAALVQNTDLLPTMVSLAGAVVPPDVDGVSLLPLMAQPDLQWRESVLLELTNDGSDPEARETNPDARGVERDRHAPTYNALRTTDFLYVDYSLINDVPPRDGVAEFYDLTSTPHK